MIMENNSILSSATSGASSSASSISLSSTNNPNNTNSSSSNLNGGSGNVNNSKQLASQAGKSSSATASTSSGPTQNSDSIATTASLQQQQAPNGNVNNNNSNKTSSSSSVSPTPLQSTLGSGESRWLFNTDKVDNTPSRGDGVSMDVELNERQETALFITDLGAYLKVNQLCINTAIIYMHRFYMIHSLRKFHHYMIAAACLFLACKVEEQPRPLKQFIDAIQHLFHKLTSDSYNTEESRKKVSDEIVALESCLLQTLGFDVLVAHAHTVIIKTCQMIKAPRDLAEAAYLTASNSLVLTNFCVKFSSEKIACFCIYLACKWTGLIIPTSSEGRQWYQYVTDDIVEQELEDISKEYLTVYDKCLPMVQKKLGKAKTTESTAAAANESSWSSSSSTRSTNQPHPNPQKFHHSHQQQQQGQHAQHHSGSAHPNMKRPVHHNIDNQASNVNIKQSNQQQQQQQAHNLPKQPGAAAPHPHPHPYSQHTQKHPNVPSAQQSQQQPPQQQQQQQQRVPHPNLNKSLNIPSNNVNQQMKQPPMKHPSSSNLNLNKQPNGQNSNQNGAQFAQTSANIKHEPNLKSDYQNASESANNNNNNNNNNNSMKNLNKNKHFQSSSGNSSSISTSMKASPSTSSLNLPIKSSPSSSQGGGGNNAQSSTTPTASASSSASATNSSGMKRGNEDLTSAPNKIPKYIIDQKSAS